jgi:hypothetical protein
MRFYRNEGTETRIIRTASSFALQNNNSSAASIIAAIIVIIIIIIIIIVVVVVAAAAVLSMISIVDRSVSIIGVTRAFVAGERGLRLDRVDEIERRL